MATERKNRAATFLDAATADLGGRKVSTFLDRCQWLIPWDELAGSVRDVFVDNGGPGRPHWPVVTLVKCVMLAKWFNLSDPQLEDELRDRLSFRRFVGLSLEDATPDETTFVIFRRRLREAGHGSTLFEKALAILESKGLVLKEGTLVDATIVEAPRGRKTEDGLGHTKDKAATFTKKHGQTYHGYKAHIATDKRGVITDYRFGTAKEHDSKHIDGLIEGEETAVYADSAYMDKGRRERLEKAGVHCGIVERRVRGQEELTDEQQKHNRLCAAVRAIVEHPFAWIKNMGYGWARYRGLTCNALDFAFTAVAYNLKRSLSLQGSAA